MGKVSNCKSSIKDTVWMSKCPIASSHFYNNGMTQNTPQNTRVCTGMCVCNVLFNPALYFWFYDLHTHDITISQSTHPHSCLHPNATRAGQLVIHHRCLQSGWWRSGEGEREREEKSPIERGGEFAKRRETVGKDWRGKKTNKQTKNNVRGLKNRSKQGEGDSRDKQVFFLSW